MIPTPADHGNHSRADTPHIVGPHRLVSTAQIDELLRHILQLRDEVDAISDRLLYAEAALHHICDRLAIDEHGLPDPIAAINERLDMAMMGLHALGLDVPLPRIRWADPHADPEGQR